MCATAFTMIADGICARDKAKIYRKKIERKDVEIDGNV